MGPDLKRPKQKNTSKVLRSQAREREREQTENSILIGKTNQSEATRNALRHLKATNCKKEREAKITVENIFLWRYIGGSDGVHRKSP